MNPYRLWTRVHFLWGPIFYGTYRIGTPIEYGHRFQILWRGSIVNMDVGSIFHGAHIIYDI